MSRGFEPLGLDHLVLRVRDQAVSQRFYIDVLGCTLDHVNDGRIAVYPLPVAQALFARPDGLDAIYIVPKPGRTVVAENIKSFLKGKLSSFKVPKGYVVVNELPKSPTGKILKRELKKDLAHG